MNFQRSGCRRSAAIKRKLQTLEGVKIYMEPQQIRYPGFFLDMLQRKVMVEEKEVPLTAREFDILAVMARHPGTCVYLCSDLPPDLWGNGCRGRNVQYTLQRKVMVEEKEVLLTAREFDVLAAMARHPGRVYTYAQICRMIYGETDVGEEMYSSAYCLISSLRKKLEKEPRHPRYLDTVYGVGYRFEDVLEK